MLRLLPAMPAGNLFHLTVRKLQKLQNMQGSLPESMCFLHKPEEVYG